MVATLSRDIQELVRIFDTELEPCLEFDKVFKGENIRLYLDRLIKNESGWNKIAVSCRRMIICDRELDLATAKYILKNADIEIQEGSFAISKSISNSTISYKEDLYESIRYINTCGLISYRCGEYSNALEFFKRAEKMSNEFEDLCFFVPDMASNRIRTDFELFVQLLPSEIKEDYAKTYENKLNSFIKSYEEQISNFEDKSPDTENKMYPIFGHGMASLHHNLAEAYSKFLGKKGSELLIGNKLEFREKAKKHNETSLKYGMSYNDIYRQLQSKRALSEIYGSIKEDYECDVLDGRWKRGQLMLFQKRIKTSRSIETSKVKEDVEHYVKKDDFKLSPEEPDKVVLLHNYGSIKEFLNSNKEIKYIEANDGAKLTGLEIAHNRIEVAKQLRNDLYFLYRRQAIGLIREDILDIVDHYLKSGNYKEAINWSERFNCLGLIELSQLVSGQCFSQDKLIELKNGSYELKKPIFIEEVKEILNGAKEGVEERRKSNVLVSPKMNDFYNSVNDLLNNLNASNHQKMVPNHEEIVKRMKDISNSFECLDNNSSKLPLNQNCGTSDKLQNLVLFYESSFDVSSKEFDFYEDSNLFKKLQNVLDEIPSGETTAILKLIIIGKDHDKKIHPFLIKKEGTEKLEELIFDDIMKLGNNLEDNFGNSTIEQFRDLSEQFRDLNKKLRFEELTIGECLKDVKNLFIVPDGELFQLPIHLLVEDIQNNINIYYSPSLYHLLYPFDPQIHEKEKNNCLWISCPTPDLVFNYRSEKDIPNITNKETLVAKDASIDSFYEMCKPNKYTHIGFFTHGVFHNHSIDAYASNILFNDSFLTPYDILFQLDFSGVQTIFLGACGVGSNKYTDKNESVGIVTAFLDKNAISVIAPIWTIDTTIYRNFIRALNNSDELNSTGPWNLSNIKRNVENNEDLRPFVQYASIAVVVSRLPFEVRIKICELIKRKEDNEK